MDLHASLLRNKSQNFAVNIFEVTSFSTKHIFDEMSCIGRENVRQAMFCLQVRIMYFAQG